MELGPPILLASGTSALLSCVLYSPTAKKILGCRNIWQHCLHSTQSQFHEKELLEEHSPYRMKNFLSETVNHNYVVGCGKEQQGKLSLPI
jgi:hypothetical protein